MVLNARRSSTDAREQENEEEEASKNYWRRHGDDFVQGNNHTIDNQYLWTPPLAYQQSLIVETTAPIRSLAEQARQLSEVPDIALFPLELSLKDYFNRLFDLLSTTLKLTDDEEDVVESKNVNGIVSSNMETNEDENFLGAAPKLSQVKKGRRVSMIQAMIFESKAPDASDVDGSELGRILQRIMDRNKCTLVGVKVNESFETGKMRALLGGATRIKECLQLSRRAPQLMPGRLIPIDSLFDDASLLIDEYCNKTKHPHCQTALKRLQLQYNAHMRWKNHRVHRNGLMWNDKEESFPDEVKCIIDPDAERYPLNLRDSHLRERNRDLKDVLEAVIETSHLSMLMFITRTFAISCTLRRLSRESAEVSDYVEASRLRQLADTLESVLRKVPLEKSEDGSESNGLQIVDGMDELSAEAVELVLEMKEMESQLRADSKYKEAHEMFHEAAVLEKLQETLSNAIDPRHFDLLRQSRCPKDIIHCIYGGIDIDFLFNFEFDDGKSLSSLAINSNHRLLLQSIQVSWFGSMAVGNTVRQRRQSAAAATPTKYKEQTPSANINASPPKGTSSPPPFFPNQGDIKIDASSPKEKSSISPVSAQRSSSGVRNLFAPMQSEENFDQNLDESLSNIPNTTFASISHHASPPQPSSAMTSSESLVRRMSVAGKISQSVPFSQSAPVLLDVTCEEKTAAAFTEIENEVQRHRASVIGIPTNMSNQSPQQLQFQQPISQPSSSLKGSSVSPRPIQSTPSTSSPVKTNQASLSSSSSLNAKMRLGSVMRQSVSMSTSDLQMLLVRGEKLLEEASQYSDQTNIAHATLLSRLIFISHDLRSLAVWNKMKLTFEEGARLEDMALVIDHTCEADEMDPLETLATSQVGEASVGMVEVLRGRRLVDYMCDLRDDFEKLKMDILSFQKRPIHVAKPLGRRQSFAFLNNGNTSVENSNNHPVITEDDSAAVLLHKIDDVLYWLVPCVSTFSITLQAAYRRSFAATETTDFLDYEYIYRMIHDVDGQSICSLAVIAGAESLVEVIMSSWVGVKSVSHVLSNVVKGNSDGNAIPSINNDVISLHELKAMGFEAKALKEAGLNESAIIHTGYSSTDLRKAGFAIESLRSSGLDEATIRSVGLQSEIDKSSLIDFFKATDGQGSWNIKEGWKDYMSGKIRRRKNDVGSKYALTSNGGSGVYGILYDNKESVSKLVLPNNNLKGHLPKSLGFVAGLTQLVLNNNALTGGLPSKIFRLTNLSVLFLQYNDFEGPIPPEIGLLSNLVMLRLDGNRFSGRIPPEICRIASLKRLSLSNNQLSGTLPAGFDHLTELQEFVVNDNSLVGSIPIELLELKTMTTLLLHNNSFSGALPMPRTPSLVLTSLNLRGNKLLPMDRKFRSSLQVKLGKCHIHL